MPRTFFLVALSLISLIVCGCSGKERPDLELAGAQITEMTLQEIETLTRLDLPDGTEGLNYTYVRAAVKPAMQARLKLPAEASSDFLAGKEVREDPMPPLRQQLWWQPHLLQDPIHQEWDAPVLEHIRSSLGTDEEGDRILYLTWFPH